MISRLELKFGRGPGTAPEPLELTPITVFVGPNNSGKTRVLEEINLFCSNARPNSSSLILSDATFVGLKPEEVQHAIDALRLPHSLDDNVGPGEAVIGNAQGRYHMNEADYRQLLVNPSSDKANFAACFLSFHTLALNGTNRITLTNQQPAGDLLRPPQSSFQVLFRNDQKRAALRTVVHEALGLHLVVDPTNLGQLRLRLSKSAPVDARQERGIDDVAVRFHAAALPIEEASDGVRAFTGIMTEVIAGDPRVLLVDEPEAFLHPALAYKLGLEMSRASASSDKRLFVSTHSPQFVMGCIQSGVPVNIVRLTYRDGVATARILSNPDLVRLMRNPLLRSAGILAGLFYEFVVVTESDADRAFYQEINERLIRYQSDRGLPNCLFVNAQNKQTERHIIRALRDLGIPAAAVVDIDVVKEGGSVWTGLLSAAHVPVATHQPLGALRAAVKAFFEGSGKDMKTDGGVTLLSGQDRAAADDLFDQLGDYGIFVVRGGELESWLRSLGAGGHGPGWLINIFEKMGEDPESPTYLKPSTSDVWEFVSRLRTWLTNPTRKGIPS